METNLPADSSLTSSLNLQETPSVLQAALEYLRLGFSVIPLHGKRATIKWEEYQKRGPEEALVRQWFGGNDSNLGIVTGKVSGLLVLDADGLEGMETIVSKDLLLPLTPTAKTGKGTHFYFRYPDGHEIRNFARKLPGLDLRGQGGYVVAPPSLHETGARYMWEHPPDKVPLADPPVWLVELCRNTNGGIGGGGPRIDPASILEGVPEGARNETLFREAARLRSLNLKKEEAEIIILEMARRCKTPFPEREALAVVASAYRYPPGPSILPEGEKADPGKVVYEIRGVKDILEYPDPAFLIDPILVKGTVTVLGAWSGVGKSILALSIMKSILTGEPLWGKYPVLEPGPVLLVDEETPAGWLKERVQKAGITPDLPFYTLHFENVRLDDDRHFDALMQAIEKVRPVLLVIDSLIRVHRKKESDAGEMALVMGRLRQIANTGLVVFPIHHHKKGDGPLAEKMRGSSDILGGIDVEFAAVRGKARDEIQLSSGKTRMAPLEPINLKLTFGETENTVSYIGTEDAEVLELVKNIIEGEAFWRLKEIYERLNEDKEFAVGFNRLSRILATAGEKGKLEARRGSGRGCGWQFRCLP
jgi:archaellum biogenesis ATPase FlaH